MDGTPLSNRFAYIPPQCYVKTRAARGGAVHNPCYACHLHSVPPNFVDDADLQLALTLPAAAADNPWRNFFHPPIERASPISDADLLAYVRASNYFDDAGSITLARQLTALPAVWDGEGDGRWNGYVPDAWFQFDDRGFDHAPGGNPTGWRAFAYAPFPGAFFPTNGSMDDVLVRLDAPFRQDAVGNASQIVYEVNLAIVEALIKRGDVQIDPVDERPLGTDLDGNRSLGQSTQVRFHLDPEGRPAMSYVGRAGVAQRAGLITMAAGLFPLGTEFLHSVRYLDVHAEPQAGGVAMAARMKELRYSKKVRWFSPEDLRAHAAAEATEQLESADGAVEFVWQHDRGIYNNQGWLLQGFIEGASGSLRPQSYQESLACAGCHGEVGATVDSMFAFARKLDGPAPSRGWFHSTQRGLRGLTEPKAGDGSYEYTLYLEANGAADDLRDNSEVQARFFDRSGRPRADQLERLHADMALLLLPTPARALALDRAYLAIVREQAFAGGRDAVLAASENIYGRAPIGEKTGIVESRGGPPHIFNAPGKY